MFIQKEKQFQSLLSKHLPKILNHTAPYEAKIVKHPKKTLNLNTDFQPQQIPSLYKAFTGCIHHKISDQSINLKPFDGFIICNSPAYVAIHYTKKDKPRSGCGVEFYLIHIQKLIEYTSLKNTHLLPEIEAGKIGDKYVL